MCALVLNGYQPREISGFVRVCMSKREREREHYKHGYIHAYVFLCLSTGVELFGTTLYEYASYPVGSFAFLIRHVLCQTIYLY